MARLQRKKDGRKKLHGRNGREYMLPEFPRFCVDGFCPETNAIYEFFGCYYHGRTCQTLRDVSTVSADNLTE